uniref:TATA-binding protein-associated factor 172 n=1 Tax=Anopheles atroparvus TaxID=41427 RepID=A0AAG5D4I1_ANOAO
MTSRLDRLFILLESGSAAVTRKAAAKQIGEVQKLHPHELHNLLSRLQAYLHSTSWDTRIAASQAVQAILENVPQWDPKGVVVKVEKEEPRETGVGGEERTADDRLNDSPGKGDASSSRNGHGHRLSFDSFDLNAVLFKGARLMGSEGSEFDPLDENEVVDLREKLARQRALLNEKLGLSSGINVEEIVTLDDVRNDGSGLAGGKDLHQMGATGEKLVPVQEILKLNRVDSSEGLSCREKNRARRKARQQQQAFANPITAVIGAAGSGSVAAPVSALGGNALSGANGGLGGQDGEPDRKRVKTEKGAEPLGPGSAASAGSVGGAGCTGEAVPDLTGAWVEAIDWPLEAFCTKLFLDLFSPRWETRHGSATALRELLKSHADGAGKSVYMTKAEMDSQHQLWLEDATLRLLCVLALDRFGDFVSDQVVAPVRETCAQVLGTVLRQLPLAKVHQTVSILLTFVKQKEWEVRHGGLLGIKYMLVVREDLVQTFLPVIINDVLTGLFDAVDDVGAVAASTLIPIASWLPKLLSRAQVSHIVKLLWDLLLDQDELASACNSFMGLLASILSLPSASSWIQMEPMSILVPRLWPFLSHCSSSVRRSTLQTLKTLTNSTITEREKEEPSNGGGTPNGKSLHGESIESKDKENSAGVLKVPESEDSKLVLNFGVKDWPPPLLQEALRHIFQRVLVEHVEDIQALAEDVWYNLVVNAELSALLHASCPYVSSWLCLAMQPVRLAFDPGSLIFAKPIHSGNRERRRQFDSFDAGGQGGGGNIHAGTPLHQKLFLGGAETVPLDVREKNVVRARCKASRMIGLLSRYLVLPAPGVSYTPEMESPIDCYTKVLIGYLQSRSALQRLISSLVIAYWCSFDGTIQPGPPVLQDRLRACLNEYVYYDEVAILFTRLLQECRDYLATLKQHKVPLVEYDQLKVLTLDQIYQIATAVGSSVEEVRARHCLKTKIAEMLEERRRGLLGSHSATALEQTTLHISTQSSVSGAVVSLHCLPERLNPVVKPLMESIKREECELLQKLSAKYLSDLLEQVTTRTPCPNSKIVTNLCTLLKSDPEFTPRVLCPDQELQHFDAANTGDCNPYHGILTLIKQQRSKENGGSNPSGSSGTAGSSRGPGRPAAAAAAAAAVNPNVALDLSSSAATSAAVATAGIIAEEQQQHQQLLGAVETEETSRKHARTQRLGATAAITTICAQFKASLPQKLPILWQLLLDKIQSRVDEAYVDRLALDVIAQDDTNDFMTSLQLLEVAAPFLDASLHDELFKLLPKLCLLLRHPLKAVRHMVGRCLGTLASVDTATVMTMVINDVVPLLSCIENVIKRQGSAEAIACIVNRLQFEIVPYVVLLVVPLLGRMSDPDQSVRLVSTHCFATLIQLMPLDGLVADSATRNLSEDLKTRKMKDRRFLEYLFSPKTIPDFEIPVKINAELRSYQQSGVNWLWFLNRYKLHGILCDDMGLGKTLQAICILAADHHQRSTDRRTCAQLPSLVICPPTLTGHWVYEVEKFLPTRFLRPLHYVGLPVNREQLRLKLGTYNLIVASYDIVRKDIEFFSSVHWNYCILDEGHIIKNGKTKSSKAIKQLVANHRLILSGTPIQNNVLELWSLFDFLMPGFLGTEKQFSMRFSRPILASRDPKSSPKEQEAGALAMEALHRQVLPFLLRRVKEDVLTDLPPKITQDLLCELSPLQERLYEDFSRTHLNSSDIRECLENIDGQMGPANKKTHVFQALRYLQNVCNHPKLVLSPSHPEYQMIVGEFTRNGSSMDDIEHSAKLPVLKQLLLDCGIGTNEDVSVNQHRALIFCQLKAMLDIVENDLLKKHLPAVSYLRLDGSVPPSTRHHIVTKFNGDPSIDVLLLTTQVGGLGLNLTGADTVIFVEHDWNPMKDLQAMDRAHRIGQKKVVNVYRLITRKSLEEKIMGLQKFKLLTANTIVSDDNASMDTMGTDQLLDLFTLADDTGKLLDQ